MAMYPKTAEFGTTLVEKGAILEEIQRLDQPLAVPFHGLARECRDPIARHRYWSLPATKESKVRS